MHFHEQTSQNIFLHSPKSHFKPNAWTPSHQRRTPRLSLALRPIVRRLFASRLSDSAPKEQWHRGHLPLPASTTKERKRLRRLPQCADHGHWAMAAHFDGQRGFASHFYYVMKSWSKKHKSGRRVKNLKYLISFPVRILL